MSYLEITGIAKSFGGVHAVSDFDLSIEKGEVVSIIGPNGAGKTTLFNILSGLIEPDEGDIVFKGHNITRVSAETRSGLGMTRTFQHGRVCGNLSVIENVLVGSGVRSPYYGKAFGLVRELFDSLVGGKAVREREAAARTGALGILALFGDRLLPRKDEAAFSLSYANRRRTELARALASKPDILLLDEPTAGMNQSETREMTELFVSLKRGGQTMLVIEHKMDLVNAVSDRLVVMDDGLKISEGDPRSVQEDVRVVDAYLGRAARGVPVKNLEAVNI